MDMAAAVIGVVVCVLLLAQVLLLARLVQGRRHDRDELVGIRSALNAVAQNQSTMHDAAHSDAELTAVTLEAADSARQTRDERSGVERVNTQSEPPPRESPPGA